MRKFLFTLVFVSHNFFAEAQCAMCRTTLQNNVSQGDPGIAAGINFGILYLLAAPYLAVGLLAYFWYRTSRKNERQQGHRLA